MKSLAFRYGILSNQQIMPEKTLHSNICEKGLNLLYPFTLLLEYIYNAIIYENISICQYSCNSKPMFL